MRGKGPRREGSRERGPARSLRTTFSTGTGMVMNCVLHRRQPDTSGSRGLVAFNWSPGVAGVGWVKGRPRGEEQKAPSRLGPRMRQARGRA